MDIASSSSFPQFESECGSEASGGAFRFPLQSLFEQRFVLNLQDD